MSSHNVSPRLLQAIDQSLTDLTRSLRNGHSEEFRAYLKVMARFHRYSARNIWLILRQRPDARLVAGRRRWHSLGRRVRHHESGIAILAPTVIRCPNHDEDREKPPAVLEGFHVTYVWDISQTEGRPLPDYVGEGIHGSFTPDALARALRAAPLPVRFTPLRGDGETDGREIRLTPGLSPARTLVALVHEWAHVLLHLDPAGEIQDLPPNIRELEAEATAFVVAAHHGIEDRSGSDYILSYGGSVESLHQHIERIRRAASSIIMRLHVELSSVPPLFGDERLPFARESLSNYETTAETRSPQDGLEKN